MGYDVTGQHATDPMRLWVCSVCGSRRLLPAGEDRPSELACPNGHEVEQVGTATRPRSAAVLLFTTKELPTDGEAPCRK